MANGGWLIAVHDGASPERLAVLDKRTQTVQLAITYYHDELRAGINSGALEIVNGSLIPFDDYTQSNDGKGAGRKPSRAGLLTCFSDLGQAYKSPERRRTMLYQGIRWSPTANIHRQTQAFLEIEEAIVLNQNDVDFVSQQIMTTPTEGGSSLADQLETLLYKEIPDGFIWRHTHNLTIPYALEGVGHRPGWVGSSRGSERLKVNIITRHYAPMGDEDGQGR